MFEANGNRMKPAHATVTISKPITPEDYANMDIKELTKHTQEVIASQLHNKKDSAYSKLNPFYYAVGKT